MRDGGGEWWRDLFGCDGDRGGQTEEYTGGFHGGWMDSSVVGDEWAIGGLL